MPTEPITYRVSPEVDAELKRLAGIHGGVDKVLRAVLGIAAKTGVPARILEANEESSRAVAETHAKPFERPMRQKGDKTR